MGFLVCFSCFLEPLFCGFWFVCKARVHDVLKFFRYAREAEVELNCFELYQGRCFFSLVVAKYVLQSMGLKTVEIQVFKNMFLKVFTTSCFSTFVP